MLADAVRATFVDTVGVCGVFGGLLLANLALASVAREQDIAIY